MSLRIHEKVEIVFIFCTVGAVWRLAHLLPDSLQLGWSFALGSLILLFQGFFRDLYLLYLQKAHRQDQPKRKMKCMCLESTLGTIGILIGITLALIVPDTEFPVNQLGWVVFVAVIMALGFGGKDLVVTWKPFGLHRDPDHANIIFTLN